MAFSAISVARGILQKRLSLSAKFPIQIKEDARKQNSDKSITGSDRILVRLEGIDFDALFVL